MTTFRFDDVSVNTDPDRLGAMIRLIFDTVPDSEVLLGISSIVFSPDTQLPRGQRQRVHPMLLTAGSSITAYMLGQRCGRPEMLNRRDPRVRFAGHGIVHVDHRLLSYETQELSVLMSCSLANDALTFIPPYNKYNEDTVEICDAYDIELIRFEDGWRHVCYNSFDPEHGLFYLHPFDLTVAELKEWFQR